MFNVQERKKEQKRIRMLWSNKLKGKKSTVLNYGSFLKKKNQLNIWIYSYMKLKQQRLLYQIKQREIKIYFEELLTL